MKSTSKGHNQDRARDAEGRFESSAQQNNQQPQNHQKQAHPREDVNRVQPKAKK